MAQQWTWGTVADTLAGGWQEFIRLCNRRMRDLEVLLKGVVSVATGSGTTNVLPKWTGAQTLGDSGLSDDGTALTAARKLQLGINPNVTTQDGLPNSGGIGFKSIDGTTDKTMIASDASDQVVVFGVWATGPTNHWYPTADDAQDIGRSSFRARRLYLSSHAMIRGVDYTWPSANASGVLTNNGSGTLSWAASGGSGGGGMNALQAAGF